MTFAPPRKSGRCLFCVILLFSFAFLSLISIESGGWSGTGLELTPDAGLVPMQSAVSAAARLSAPVRTALLTGAAPRSENAYVANTNDAALLGRGGVELPGGVPGPGRPPQHLRSLRASKRSFCTGGLCDRLEPLCHLGVPDKLEHT